MDDRHVILYADDDADDREMVTELIEKIDPAKQVVTATDGQDAIDKLHALHALGKLPCLIVLDINMPGMDGRETLERIRCISNWDDIPVCMYSTSTRVRFADIALKYDVDIVLKPTSAREFEASINQLLAHCK